MISKTQLNQYLTIVVAPCLLMVQFYPCIKCYLALYIMYDKEFETKGNKF